MQKAAKCLRRVVLTQIGDQMSRDMATRMTITIDDDIYKILESWADKEVRTVANLAAAIVTLRAREAVANSEVEVKK